MGSGAGRQASRAKAEPVYVMPVRSSRRLKFCFVQALTLVRVPLIFLFLAVSVFCRHPVSEFWFLVAFAAMILSAVTDLFDGYFARKFQVTSRLGSYADPMTDKVFYLTTFPTLVYLADRVGQHAHARVLLVLAILFLLRDQWVSFLRSLGSAPRPERQGQLVGKGAHPDLVPHHLRDLLLPAGASRLGFSGARLLRLWVGGPQHGHQLDLNRRLHQPLLAGAPGRAPAAG